MSWPSARPRVTARSTSSPWRSTSPRCRVWQRSWRCAGRLAGRRGRRRQPQPRLHRRRAGRRPLRQAGAALRPGRRRRLAAAAGTGLLRAPRRGGARSPRPDAGAANRHYDPQLYLIVMERLSPHIIMRRGMIDGVVYPHFAGHIAEYLAQTLFHSSDWPSRPRPRRPTSRCSAPTPSCARSPRT